MFKGAFSATSTIKGAFEDENDENRKEGVEDLFEDNVWKVICGRMHWKKLKCSKDIHIPRGYRFLLTEHKRFSSTTLSLRIFSVPPKKARNIE